jgi:O-antigen/teichoic acid export membrane protein
MSTIRRQSIISSVVIYIGFAIGLLNTYFFTKESLFAPDQYGLTSIFVAIATMMSALSLAAMPSYIFKFYHYYNDHLPPRKNDLLTWALLVSIMGFILVMLIGWWFKGLVIRKFGEHSPLLVTYYYWIFPMGLGLTLYSILENYTWALGKPVVTSFLKEVLWRLFTTLLIVVMLFVQDFDLFIKLYAFTFPGIAVALFIYLLVNKKIHFTFKRSKVTRRYFWTIVKLCAFIYSGTVIVTLSQVFDTIVIAAKLDDGMAKAGIFALAQILGSVIQAPQRGIVAASVTHLSRAWKEKNMGALQRIYQRSSINQLVFAIGLFCLIALNYTDAVLTLHLKEIYLSGFNAFILLGLMRIVDMGTGVNAQIISTSNYWKFEFVSGMVLLVLMLPLTYILTQRYDILGPAIANLISITIYNLIRIAFLWKKFRLFPFTKQSLYTVLVGAVSFTICYYVFAGMSGFAGLALRSIGFILLYATGTIYLKLTPDIQPVMAAVRKRLGLR